MHVLLFFCIIAKKANHTIKVGKEFLDCLFVVDMIKIVISKLHFRWDTAFFFAVFITSVIITEVLSEDWLRLLFDKFMNRLNILLRLND